MDLRILKDKKQHTLHQQIIDGVQLTVKETEQYRWFEYGGPVIQSVMNKTTTEKIASPVSQSLLLFFLFKFDAVNILILGSGGGAIERALVARGGLQLTSVELSQQIIDLSKSYFNFPEKLSCICDSAQSFIYKSKVTYDVICCDLFIDKKNPDFIFTEPFYAQLSKITTEDGMLLVNIKVDNEAVLLKFLLMLRKYFKHVNLVEFNHYENIVAICSKNNLPSQDSLLNSLRKDSSPLFTDLYQEINKIFYFPANT